MVEGKQINKNIVFLFIFNMAQFIHPENQKLLWDTINKSPLFQNIDPTSRVSWFKMRIQKLYDEIGPTYFQQSIQPTQLDSLNRSILRNMIQELKQPSQPSLQYQPPQSLQYQQQPPQPTPAPTKSNFQNSYIQQNPSRPNYGHNMDSLQNVYMTKKSEMEVMMNKKVPDQIDFSMKEKDEPIMNMEEMVKKYMKDRDLHVATTMPVLPVQPPSSQQLQPSQIKQPLNIVQNRENENIVIPVQDISTGISIQEVDTKKKVSFLDENIHEEVKELRENMKEIKECMNEMKEYMKEFSKFCFSKMPKEEDPSTEISEIPKEDPSPEITFYLNEENQDSEDNQAQEEQEEQDPEQDPEEQEQNKDPVEETSPQN